MSKPMRSAMSARSIGAGRLWTTIAAAMRREHGVGGRRQAGFPDALRRHASRARTTPRRAGSTCRTCRGRASPRRAARTAPRGRAATGIAEQQPSLGRDLQVVVVRLVEANSPASPAGTRSITVSYVPAPVPVNQKSRRTGSVSRQIASRPAAETGAAATRAPSVGGIDAHQDGRRASDEPAAIQRSRRRPATRPPAGAEPGGEREARRRARTCAERDRRHDERDEHQAARRPSATIVRRPRITRQPRLPAAGGGPTGGAPWRAPPDSRARAERPARPRSRNGCGSRTARRGRPLRPAAASASTSARGPSRPARARSPRAASRSAAIARVTAADAAPREDLRGAEERIRMQPADEPGPRRPRRDRRDSGSARGTSSTRRAARRHARAATAKSTTVRAAAGAGQAPAEREASHDSAVHSPPGSRAATAGRRSGGPRTGRGGDDERRRVDARQRRTSCSASRTTSAPRRTAGGGPLRSALLWLCP